MTAHRKAADDRDASPRNLSATEDDWLSMVNVHASGSDLPRILYCGQTKTLRSKVESRRGKLTLDERQCHLLADFVPPAELN